MRLIKIEVDIGRGRLRLVDEGQRHVPLQPNEDVEWIFIGIPNTYFPAIEFQVGDLSGESPRGPFAQIRQSSSQIFGSGRSGNPQQIRYHIRLQRVGQIPQADDPRIGPLEIVVHSDDAPGMAPTVVVKPELGSEIATVETPGLLEVSPEYFSIFSGDTVTWVFDHFEEPRWAPVIQFFGGPDPAEIWPFGPFESLRSGNRMVVGAGNNHVEGPYGYNVFIVDHQSGKPLRSWKGDPGLGNNGDPPGGNG